MKTRRLLPLVLLLAAFPAVAQANVGTALVLTMGFHLLLGNAVIGTVEAGLLVSFFGTPRTRSTVALVLANYVSAWLGVFLLDRFAEWIAPGLYAGRAFYWVCAILAYLATLLLEWPFVAWCFRGTQNWLRRSIRADLVIQTVTYIPLFAWYGYVSVQSLYTGAQVVPPQEIPRPDGLMLYYISEQDGDVYRRPLADGEPELVFDLNSQDGNDRLFPRPSPEKEGCWDVCARLEPNTNGNRGIVLVAAAAGEAVPGNGDTGKWVSEMWMDFGTAPKLGAAKDSPWEFRTGFWPAEGLSGRNSETGERVRLAFETLPLRWAARNAVHLPGNLVLFQLDWYQICIYEAAAGKVALLQRGRGPLVVIPGDGGP